MAHTIEKKQGVLDILYTKAEGNVSKCARLTGIARKTIINWQQEREEYRQQQAEAGKLPEAKEIKEKIIRRVYEIIDTCSDPKKLMDAYEAVSKLESQDGPKESIFDIIQNKLQNR